MKEGLAEVCGAELAGGREYEFKDAALIGVFTYHVSLSRFVAPLHPLTPLLPTRVARCLFPDRITWSHRMQ